MRTAFRWTLSVGMQALHTAALCVPAWPMSGSWLRPQVLVSAVTLAAFGVTGAMLGGANVFRGGARVVIGGLAAMGITFGFGRIFSSTTARMP